VLLQRVGRLHRHVRNRLAGFEQPRCLLLVPEVPLVEGLDDRGQVAGDYKRLGYGSVYPDLRILALTWAAVAQQPELRIPQQNRWFVEQAVHPERWANLKDPRWAQHEQRISGETLMHHLQAGLAVLDFHQPFHEFRFQEMGEGVATRLGADRWCLPLDRPVRSPFDQTLQALQIPDHLAARSDEETLIVVQETPELVVRWGKIYYRYTRFGLEKNREPAQ